MDWIKEIPQVEKHIADEDMQIIIDGLGIDALLFLLDKFGKSPLSLSGKSVNKLKKLYIKQNYPEKSVKSLSRILGVSQTFVFSTLKEKV